MNIVNILVITEKNILRNLCVKKYATSYQTDFDLHHQMNGYLIYILTILEPVCCKKRQKSPNQETGLGNRRPLEALNDAKLILND